MAAYLIPMKDGRRIVIDKAVVFIGRHPDCDVVLTNSRKVSRRHCCLALVNDRLMVRDLGSMNGVRVNGRRVTKEAPLVHGDELLIGDIAYVLQTRNGELPRHAPIEPARSNPPRNGDLRATPPADYSQSVPVPLPDDLAPDSDPDSDEEIVVIESPDGQRLSPAESDGVDSGVLVLEDSQFDEPSDLEDSDPSD
ncbi:MAG: FHA domain-containing protein [Planctomycetaceae bacterium]